MNVDDEQLQSDAEKGLPTDEMDSKAYRLVFAALRKEPEYRMSSSFADRVVSKIQEKQKGSSSEFFWFGLGIVLLLIAFVVAIAMTGFKIDLGFLSGMSSYYRLFIFGAVFAGFLSWIDRRFIQHRQ
jgi:hypothetical protein